jgi:hypothetical protein
VNRRGIRKFLITSSGFVEVIAPEAPGSTRSFAHTILQRVFCEAVVSKQTDN